ncbi:MAG TPA: hypothetical protein VKA21_15310, partial [Candidatus Binatia bacterium]|nr:hypothetical protein [Candidatus Binatia bacterium]
ETLAAVDLRETTVVLFAAHGMRANTSQSHLLQRIMDRVNATFWQTVGRATATPGRSIFRKLRETIPPSMQLAITHATPEGFRDWVVDRAQRKGLDWSATPGLALVCGQTGLIRLNVAGREREGLLPRDDGLHARYVDWLRDALLELRTPDSGRPLVDAVELVQELFPGARSAYLPDVAVRWSDMPPVLEATSSRLGTIRARFGTGRPGNHCGAAFAAVMGREEHAAAFAGVTHTAELAGRVLRCLAPHAAERFRGP